MESILKTFKSKTFLFSDVRRVLPFSLGSLSAGFLPTASSQPLTPSTITAWGSNAVALGQTNIPGGLNNVTAFTAGSLHSLALKSDGTVVTWGNNLMGQIRVPSRLNSVTASQQGRTTVLPFKLTEQISAGVTIDTDNQSCQPI